MADLMAAPFAHTLRSLEVDGSVAGRVLLAISLVLLGGWATGLFAAEVGVSEYSDRARVQVTGVETRLRVAFLSKVPRLGARSRSRGSIRAEPRSRGSVPGCR